MAEFKLNELYKSAEMWFQLPLMAGGEIEEQQIIDHGFGVGRFKFLKDGGNFEYLLWHLTQFPTINGVQLQPLLVKGE